VRKRVDGTSARPRLVVTRSLRQIYAQVVDDSASRTLASASSLDVTLRGKDGDKSTSARAVGELVAQRAKEAGITAVVFDRSGNKYGGRVAALADGARAAGLEF
jgi:large subunit ribosomal protein L18